MQVRRLLTAGLSVGVLLAVGGVLVAPAAAQPGAASGWSPGPTGVAGRPQTVVLITGDRVQVNPDGSVVTQPAPGREHITFATSRSHDRVMVVPSDAVPFLVAGRLDERLFDVTTLVANGVAERGELPLIVQYARGAGDRSRSAVPARGARVARELPAIRGYALRENRSNAGELWRSLTEQAGAAARSVSGPDLGGLRGADLGGVEKVWLDGRRPLALAESVPLINAPAAWAAGLDGTGVRVAVLDTGIDATHPDLAGKVVGQANMTEGYEDDLDRSGHGTHVASILAGSGAASGGQYRGVAPGVELLDVKVCVHQGCADSWLIAGMHWAVENGAQIVNMSVGKLDSPGLDPVEQAVNELSATHGALFVVSAGNDGPQAGTVDSPGTADAALMVGNLHSPGAVDVLSSRGPTADGMLKPDILAPGVDITAARSSHGVVGEPGQPYVTGSGTSAAAPHVAGAAAILKQKNPQWTGNQLKAALLASAVPFAGASVFEQGAGVVDVQGALAQTVVAEPASVSFGRAAWPHDDDPAVTTDITYRNSGSADANLSLDVVAVGPDGQPVPAGMFTVDVDQVTVPAGGTATVRLTASPREGTVDGLFGGWLVATGDGVVVRTPFGVDRESEHYDVTLRFTDRSGAPTVGHATLLAWETDAAFEVYEVSEATVRVPAGQYAFVSATLNLSSALLASPRLIVDRTLTIDVDARQAQPVSVTLPDRKVRSVDVAAGAYVTTPAHEFALEIASDDISNIHTGRIGPDVTMPGFASMVTGTWARTDAAGSIHNTPLVYHLAWPSEGRMESGLTRVVIPRDLAKVKTSYARQAENGIGLTFTYARTASASASFAVALPLDLPGERTVYYSVEPGLRWHKEFEEAVPNGTPWPDTVSIAVADTIYQAGRTYTESWNQAVLGPRVGIDVGEPQPSAIRSGNTIDLFFPFADGDGRTGGTRSDFGRLRLFRDGTLVGESDYLGGSFTVPPEPAQYRVEIELERGQPHTLSTRVQAAWTFRSAHTDQAVALPMSSVRMRPSLDNTNAAKRNRSLAIPVTVAPQPGSAVPITKVRVEVSYDDGATWRPATVHRTGQGWTAKVKHPDQAGFASLRVTATGPHGVSVEQTVIRAYRIR